MLRNTLGLAAALFPLAATAQVPDWCASNNLTLTERMICTDAILSRLDRELTATYAEARRVDAGLDQSAWLAAREACEIRVSCLEEVYRDRIAELEGIAGKSVAGAPDRGGAASADAEIVVEALPEPWPEAPLDRSSEPDTEPPFPWDALDDLPEDEPLPVEPPQSFAYEDGALDEPVLLPEDLSRFEYQGPRPWCGASRLNPSERTICADPDLTRLDALLEAVYGRRTARNDDVAQLRWLRGERDACGTSPSCIAMAYARRIEELLR